MRLSRVQESRQISSAGLCTLVPRAGSRKKQQEHRELGYGTVISRKSLGDGRLKREPVANMKVTY